MALKVCSVLMQHGRVTYTTQVQAESAFEATLLALKDFSANGYSLANRAGIVNITIRDAFGTQVHVEKAWKWLDRQGTTPREQARKARLKAMLVMGR